MKVSKMMDMGKDYAWDAMDHAKDFLPSKHQMAHGMMHVMPDKLKRMELAKMILLPAAGIVIGLMLAPKSGKELRQDMKRSFTDVKDTGMEKAHDLKEVSVEKMHDVTDKATEMKDKYVKKAEDTLEDKGLTE